MPGVFLSHSSQDKPIVTKLAADLVSRGISVWLDTWEIETGDSLFQRLFDGIDDSTYLLLALSPNSVKSRWVTRELMAALAKEDSLRRKVIFPIMLADCEVPLAIADRLYADFGKNYLAALEKLEIHLKRSGACVAQAPISRELVPLVFTKGIYLDTVRLQNRVEQLAPRLREAGQLSTEQLLVVPDTVYDDQRSAFLTLLETYPKLTNYAPDIHQALLRGYNMIRRGEEALLRGVAELAHGLLCSNNWGFLYLSADWFARIVRHQILARFEVARRLTNFTGTTPEPAPLIGLLIDPAQTATFFEVDEVFPCDVFRSGHREYIRVWLARRSEVGHWLHQHQHLPVLFRDFATPDLVHKYVMPQMVARHCWLNPSSPLAWDLETSDWMLGAA